MDDHLHWEIVASRASGGLYGDKQGENEEGKEALESLDDHLYHEIVASRAGGGLYGDQLGGGEPSASYEVCAPRLSNNDGVGKAGREGLDRVETDPEKGIHFVVDDFDMVFIVVGNIL